jgi:hypothetical protein
MALQKKFSRLTTDRISEVPDNIVVYELARKGSGGEYETLYLGEGKLHSRLAPPTILSESVAEPSG